MAKTEFPVSSQKNEAKCLKFLCMICIKLSLPGLPLAVLAAIPEETEDGQEDRDDESDFGKAVADAVHTVDNRGVIRLDGIDILTDFAFLDGGFLLQYGALMLQVAHVADVTQVIHGLPPFLRERCPYSAAAALCR